MQDYDENELIELKFAMASAHAILGKAGYKPSQPRVPAGRSAGGQWTDSGGGTGNAKPKDRKYPKPKVGKAIIVKNPRTGKIPEQINIFIGGAGDKTLNHNVSDSRALHKNIAGVNYYFTNEDADKISKLISKLPQEKIINVIGHSWGGDTAARVIIEKPGRVDTLVTIDPVTTFSAYPNFDKVKISVAKWVNVYAAGNPSNSVLDDIMNGNLAASTGEWADRAKQQSSIYITAPFDHAEFDNLLRYTNSKRQSAEKILLQAK